MLAFPDEWAEFGEFALLNFEIFGKLSIADEVRGLSE